MGFRDYLLSLVKRDQNLLWTRERQLISANLKRQLLSDVTVSLAAATGIAFMLATLVSGRITVGQLVFCMGLVVSNIRRAESDAAALTRIHESAVRVDTLRTVMATAPTIQWPVTGLVLAGPTPPNIEFRGVHFSYPRTGVRVLSDMTFRVDPGQRIAIVGENGAGKTTLIKLLLRLYDPDAGHILINGQDLREYNLEEYWKRVAYFPQDFVKYNLTARENIAMGNIGLLANDSALMHAATQVGMRAKIDSLPLGLDTELGTRFGKAYELSIGEWQRIALARLFTRDTLLAVLDEPTASLDAMQESEILERTVTGTTGKTTLTVSHRLLTAQTADRILVLQDGRLVDQGSHEQLLVKKGLYADMYGEQAKRYRTGARIS